VKDTRTAHLLSDNSPWTQWQVPRPSECNRSNWFSVSDYHLIRTKRGRWKGSESNIAKTTATTGYSIEHGRPFGWQARHVNN